MSNMIQFFTSLWQANPLYLIANALMLVILFIVVLFIVQYEHKHNRFAAVKAKVKADLQEQERLRNEEYRKQFEMEGETDKKTRMQRLAKVLVDSGLKERFPELTGEIFLLFCAVIVTAAGVVSFALIKSFIFTLIAVLAAVAAIYVFVEIKISSNYAATEREIIKFVNLLENVSHTEGNIAEMLGRTVPYILEPLKSSVEKCYFEIKSTGDTSAALQHLTDRTNYKKLREVFNSLRICSLHNEDYEEVIAEERESIRMYIAYRKEKQQIKKSSMIDMLIMGVAGVVIVYALSTMVENCAYLIFQTLAGQIILAIIFAILVYGIWITIKQDKK